MVYFGKHVVKLLRFRRNDTFFVVWSRRLYEHEASGASCKHTVMLQNGWFRINTYRGFTHGSCLSWNRSSSILVCLGWFWPHRRLHYRDVQRFQHQGERLTPPPPRCQLTANKGPSCPERYPEKFIMEPQWHELCAEIAFKFIYISKQGWETLF